MEQTRQSLEAAVLERAATDPQFRDQLRHDPRGTVARDYGTPVPEDITIEVLEETPSKVYLVLPPAAAGKEQELSDQDLEAISGGWTQFGTQCGTCWNDGPTCRPWNPLRG